MTHRDIYYKATRLNGTDFRTGRVKYEVGKCVRPLPHDGERMLCGPGFLHAADVPAETLVGGTWPCRLFEVKGKPSKGFNNAFPHKGGFRQLVVVREIEAWRALGPNGSEVAELIERARRLTAEEVDELAAAWRAASRVGQEVDRVAARVAVRVAARYAARDAASDAARFAAVWGDAWDAVRVAASDVTAALVVRDLISEEYFNVLHGPWKAAVG
jgi:hypothetical protein